MSTKKHNLTAGKDHLDGKAGSDLFIGTKAELGSNDVLNGGGGIDTISAELTGKNLMPVMTSIEKGIFTHQGKTAVGLDLANAQRMSDLTLMNFAVNATISNASDVQSITLNNLDGHTVKVSGLDMTKFLSETIKVANSSDATLIMRTEGGLLLHKIDVTLNNSSLTLNGDTAVTELAIHSISKHDNTLEYGANSSLESIQKVTLDGSAALDLDNQAFAFHSMKIFDGSGMDGALSAQLSSKALTYVRGGSDNDYFSIYQMGGTQSAKADLNMGAGADAIWINSNTFDGSRMVLDGGDGVDVATYNGTDKGMATGFKNFETLKLQNAEGLYHLNADWKTIEMQDGSEFGDGLVIKGGTGLTLIKGTADQDSFQLDDIGGSAGHKAQVRLGAGDDYVQVFNIDLNPATQHYDGGKGFDNVNIGGNVARFDGFFDNFEYLHLTSAVGTYDFEDSGILGVSFSNASAGPVIFNNIASGISARIYEDQFSSLAVNVAGAGNSKSDSFEIKLVNSATMGTGFGGLSAVGLSNLEINSEDQSHIAYLAQIGSAADHASLVLSGDKHLTLNAVLGSVSYIDHMEISNTGGVDMLGMLNGKKAFLSTGVVIEGGSGNDVLVGGAGADTISGGAGDNEIHGSLGADKIDLSDGGVDILVFHSADQSAFLLEDQITGFNAFKGIDISDLVSTITFGGNKNSFDDGVATLSTNHSVGFFDIAAETLYVDINHDGAMNSQDMAFHLIGVDSFVGSSLIG